MFYHACFVPPTIERCGSVLAMIRGGETHLTQIIDDSFQSFPDQHLELF
jgi:hypothetical protein